MTLEVQELEIPLNLGMASKPSEDLQEPDTLRLVQNLHWRGIGQIERRPTHGVNETVTGPSGGYYTEADACGLITRGNEVAVVTGRYGLASYKLDDGEFQFCRTRTSLTASPAPTDELNYCPVSYEVSRRFVERSQANLRDSGIFQVASAQHDGVHVIAWITLGSTAYLRCKAIDVDTGDVIASTEYLSLGSSAAFMVQACEYTESGKEGVLVAYINDASSPYTISTVRYDAATGEFVDDSALATNAVTQTFLITKNGDRIYFAYHDQATGFLKVEDRTIGSISSTHTATHGAVGVDIVVGPTRTLIVSCTTGTAYAEVFGTPANVQTLFTSSSETFYKITAAAEDLAGGTHDAVAFVTSVTSSTPTSTRVRGIEVRFTSTTPVAGLETSQPHCMTVANAFTLRGHVHVVLAVYTRLNGSDPTSATSCYVARYRAGGTSYSRYDAVAKLAHDRFYMTNYLSFDPANPGLGKQGASVYVDSSNNAWLALTADPSPTPVFTQYRFPQSIFLARISAARPMPMPYASPEPGITFVAGAVPWEYDGDFPAEAAALVPPRVVLDVSGAGTNTGTFSIIAVYEWIDAAGRLHRMPGPAVSTGAIVNKQIDVYVSRCPMRAYNDTSLGDMEPKLYITADAGTTYFLAVDSNGNVDTYDTATADGNWYKFTGAFASTTTPELPFEAGEISPEPIPAFYHVAKVVDRMWAIDAEDRSRVWFSKPLVAGYAVEWSAVNTLTIADESTAVVDMAGGAMVLARGGIYLVSGEGPDANGVGGFSPAVKMNHTVDCIDPVSVCRTPIGVVFRGRRGFYVLAGAEAQPFGVPIDPETLTDPVLDPSVSTSYRMRVVYQEQTSEIHISGIPGGDRLVYSLLEQKWSKYDATGVEVRDLAVVRGKAWHLNRISSADVLRDDLLYSHSGDSYNAEASGSWSLETPKYRLDRVGGQERLWRAWLCLKLPSDVSGIGTISMAYYPNDVETATLTKTWTGAELATDYNPSTSERVVRLPFAPNVQVVHSFKFVITCTFTGSTGGPKPLALRFQFGVRPSKGKRNRYLKG